MQRQTVSRHPIDRCRECGQAYVWVVHETFYDEEGEPGGLISREVAEHKRSDCIAMQTLERETWPVLPFA